MALTHAVSTNSYGPYKFIVANTVAKGTHTTLAAAMADAVSGDKIFVRDSVTEDVTITPGVDVIGPSSGGMTPTVTITGNLTMTGVGTSTISNLRLQTNSAAFVTVSGSSASNLDLIDCYLNASNNNGINYSSSSGSSSIRIFNCNGDLGSNTSFFNQTSAGQLFFRGGVYTNSGGSTTASTASAGTLNIRFMNFTFAVTTSSTNALTYSNNVHVCGNINTTALTCGGTTNSYAYASQIEGGTAPAISVSTGSALELTGSSIGSSNTNAITGLGTITIGEITFTGSSSTVNTSTVLYIPVRTGQIQSPSITFDGTNLLSNYATGTFTPTLDGAVSGTTTYTQQAGFYTRIGNMVWVYGNIQISAATGTGNAIIGGLPFTVKNQSQGDAYGTAFVTSWVWPTGTTQLTFRATLNTTTATIQGTGSAIGAATLQMTNAGTAIRYSLFYQI